MPTRAMMTVLLFLLALGLAWSDDSYPIYVYPAALADTAPVLDGKLDEPVWQQAPVVSGFAVYGKPEEPAPVQTSVRVLYDRQNLCFGVRCEEPAMDRLSPVVHPRDEHAIFSTEAIEIFVDPEHSNSLYYQFAINAAASLYDSVRTDPIWNSEARPAAFLGPDFWSLEFAIPWQSLGVQPRAGAVVGFNVCRDRHIGESRQWTMWARVRDGFHDPVRFGHLVLSGTPEMIGKLGAEFRKGKRTGPIVVFSDEGFAQTTYQQLAAASITALEKLVGDLEAEGKQESNEAAAAEIARRLAQYSQRVTELKQGAEQPLDAVTWTKLDLEIQKTVQELGSLLWEARLSALLSSI